MQLYFDAINLTDEQEAIEWQGDEISGPMYYEIQDYGRTYQLGMRYEFNM
jgi:outer membrane receptor protein involved in Fe transport